MTGKSLFTAALIVVGFTVADAQAQATYPNRPIRVIVPYPAGGIVDIVARAVTEQVGRDWKQTVIIEARPGGNSNIGTSAVARSEPDGYTWLVTEMRRPCGLESKRRAGSSFDAGQHHQGIRRDRAQEAG